MKKRHAVGRSRRHLVGHGKVLAAIGAVDRKLSEAQGELGLLIDAEQRAEAPERTEYMSRLWDQLEKSRHELDRRVWKRRAG